jgi:phosphomannomutase
MEEEGDPMNAFKAYDIRGIYGKDFTREDAYRIGHFIPELLKTNRVLVGHDTRASSDEIYTALTDGLTDRGADVFSIGPATTPMVYFATAKHNFDASVQITASHNPKEYNGFKVSRSGALPVGYHSGLAELEAMVTNDSPTVHATKGSIHDLPVTEEYITFLKTYLPNISDMKIGIDCSNGMTSLLVKDVFGNSPHYIFDELDCTFPNHPPNPLIEDNVSDLKALVKENSLDVGIIFDGDGDRVMFVDETGRFIRPDIITGVIAHYYLHGDSEAVLHDIRTSRAVSDHIRALGGTPHMWKVGHAFAKEKLREINGIFGGELAGHYYFRDFFNCDSGMLASLIVLNVLTKLRSEGTSFSALIDSISSIPNSGEINFKIENKQEAMEAVRTHFTDDSEPTAFFDFDGYRIEFADWWLNIRPSNTEPYLRLIVEADSDELLSGKLGEIQSILNPFT